MNDERALADGIRSAGTPMIGRHVGPFEISARLGAGGMGEVYRARDSKLGRDVAIKILPRIFTIDPDRRSRLDREARLLAALNHPHIGAIYGLEELDGTPALVLELVEGDTLAERIAKGPLPITEALTIARQIADALDAAHEKGIVHRDLKPANIKITPNGIVKVLDFGLAKAASGDASDTDLTQSPTVSIGGTHDGVILGTAPYMSPEQARGKAIDKRTDMWAFGCVLYEMLTGRVAFAGDTISDTIAAILEREPDWSAVPGATPAPILRLLRRCLDKDARRRLRDIADARIEIEDAERGTAAENPLTAGPPRRKGRLLVLSALALASAIALVSVGQLAAPSTRQGRVVWAAVPLSTSASLSVSGTDRDISVTPDGTRIVYAGNNGTQLFVRSLDQPGSASLFMPSGSVHGVFTSPNNEWVGFVQDTNTLKKVAITGGPPITLQTMDGDSWGAAWASDNTIVFATANPATGLQRVAAEPGGKVEVLTRPERERGEADHAWPEILPNGRGVLFTIMPDTGGLDSAQIAVLDLPKGTITPVLRGGHHAHYVPPGYLVYATGNTLRAATFDLESMKMGTPVLAIPQLVTTGVGAADFAVAADGTLVYMDSQPGTSYRTPVWIDRQGRETPSGAPPRSYLYPRLRPDGSIALNDGNVLKTWDVSRGTFGKLPGDDAMVVSSADGNEIVFSLAVDGPNENLFIAPNNHPEQRRRLTKSGRTHVATSVTSDRQVVYHEITESGGRDIHLLTQDPSGEPRDQPLFATAADERNGTVSPDGHWIAFESNKSSQFEVYVSPFPAVDAEPCMVSTDGGRQPVWTLKGATLFYVSPNGSLMTLSGDSHGSCWSRQKPQQFLDNRYFFGGGVLPQYDVQPDGQRVLVLKQGAGTPQIHFVLNWLKALSLLAPIK